MDRAEAAGLGVSVAGHVALLALLSLALVTASNVPVSPPAMEVSFVDEVALTSAAPQPSPAPAPAATAPDVGPTEDAAPAPAPPPPPLAREEIKPPKPVAQEPAPAPPQRRVQTRPAPTPPAPPGNARATRRPGLGDIDPRSFGRDPAARPSAPPAATMSAQAAASIGDAIRRQVQPCADRQIYPGPGSERIITPISLSLNRDGSLKTRPRVGQQRGLDDENGRYARRVADLAVNAFVSCAPLRGLPLELYDVPRGWANFTMNYRLP